MHQGKLILFCGPSGSGKTTIVHHLLSEYPQLSFSVSATTRPKRTNEIHGRDYYFISPEEFKKRIENDEFVEWEEVYENIYYGTLKAEVERIWKENKVVTFDIDVEGGMSVKEIYHKNLLDVFVEPPSMEDLHERIEGRGTESEESFKLRIAKAEFELTYGDSFSHIIVNDNLSDALMEAEKLVETFLGIEN